MSFQHWSIDVDNAGIAWLTIDVKDKSVNVLTRAVIAELADAASQLEAMPGLSAMAMISGKPMGFVYGADINEFEALEDEADVAALLDEVHATFQRIADLPCPTVAGIDGFALGGGLELALLCDRLVMTSSPKTQVGFPEVKLGLMPGYGGTGRAYARVGAAAVLDMMLTGRMVGSAEALASGLVDALAEDRDQLKAAMADVLATLGGGKPPRPVVSGEDTAALVAEAKDKFTKRARPDHTPAPFAILDHIAENAPDAAAISAAEKSIFPSLMVSPASDGLRRVFQLTDMVRKTARGSSGIENVHVVGAGVMGGDIAAVAAMSGLTVTLSDRDENAIANAIDRARVLYERRLKAPEKINAAMDRLIADHAQSGLADADLVIEAVAERLDVKQAVFAALEARVKPDAILATNTSAIPLEQIAEALTNPGRLIGLHFFNPVPVLPLVEVIWSTVSDEDSVARGMQFAGQLKKMPIRCKSSPGFVVNRALLPYINAGLELMLSGVEADKIDEALVEFGMPMGPVELADQIGLDVMLDASTPLGLPAVVQASLAEHIAEGTIGRKSGRGYYTWADMKAERPRASYDARELQKLAEDLLSHMVRECQAAVDEGVVGSADDADAAMIFGVGYPQFRGGPLHYTRLNTN
ncbi:MAG: enoyl-CoA hydratase/isomerase family protein [Alphaproteobacteria bacterium]|nr:enoyl-CoA hydratase/isomerase family protein [Alphaproteobacteria bacterium]